MLLSSEFAELPYAKENRLQQRHFHPHKTQCLYAPTITYAHTGGNMPSTREKLPSYLVPRMVARFRGMKKGIVYQHSRPPSPLRQSLACPPGSSFRIFSSRLIPKYWRELHTLVPRLKRIYRRTEPQSVASRSYVG